MFRRLRKKEEGFTLVELMVVVVIIGILVAIAVPMYTRSQAEAQKRACQANLRILDGALAQYMAAKGEAADSLDDLVTEGFILKVPTCPAGGTYSIESGRAKCSKEAELGHKYPD